MPPLSAALLILRDLGLPAAISAVALVFASALSSAALHRTDRVAAAAVAIAFAVGYNAVSGGGFHPEDTVSVLPLVAVVCALLLPRIVARAAPKAAVAAPTRAGVLVAGVASAVVLYLAHDTRLTELALVPVGAALGLMLGTHLPDRGPPRLADPDPRAGAWIVVALLLLAVWGFGVAAGVSPVAVALLVAALGAAPLAARRGGTVGRTLGWVLPAGLGVAAVVVAGV
ncbi:MAG: hypothetical protein Q8P41_15880 [Pseudomonadota bacterium]|nr:hypothetical protein [Pseudomonadota bacterium]